MNPNSISLPPSNKKIIFIFVCSCLLVSFLFLLALLIGPVNLFQLENKELAKAILLEQRFPQALVALVTGALLAACGLILQSFFRNPLADPSILGISSGSSLAIALVLLGGQWLPPQLLTFFAYFAAPIGALAVLIPLLLLSSITSEASFLLIFGLMISFFSSAFITLLMHFSSAESIKQYVGWTFGNFSSVLLSEIPFFFFSLMIPLFLLFLLLPGLKKLHLGKEYALTMGLKLKRFQTLTLLLVCIITGFSTYFCGPISFLAIAASQFSRGLLRTSNHSKLLPLSILFGSSLALVALIVSTLMPNGQLPINAILALIGVPVVVITLLQGVKR